ncbi:MAG: c-type cytochrome [bacterium]
MRSKGGIGIAMFVLGFLTAVTMPYGVARNAYAQGNKKKDVLQLAEAGKVLLREGNCLMCHSLNGEGGNSGKATDISGLGIRYERSDLRELLIKHLFKKPDIKRYEGVFTEEDIEALTQYLSTVKNPGF